MSPRRARACRSRSARPCRSAGPCPADRRARAGTDERPIVRLDGCEDRDAARGAARRSASRSRRELPPLGPDEWWAEELEGARVFDGERELGVVRRLLALPSCECLEVARDGAGGDLLVPLVRDAIRSVDVGGGRIDVDLRSSGEAPPA